MRPCFTTCANFNQRGCHRLVYLSFGITVNDGEMGWAVEEVKKRTENKGGDDDDDDV